MSRTAALATAVALFSMSLVPTAASPCSQAKLPPVDIALFHATIEQEILSSLADEGGTWTLLGAMPISNSEFSVAVVDGLFYAVGGFLTPNQAKLLIYDPEGDSWSEGAPLPNPTHHAGVVAVGGKVYSIGGTRAESLVQIYDPRTDSWDRGVDMPTPRTAPAAVVLDGLIHVIGGAGNINIGNAMKAHEVYDPAADRWEARAEVPKASEHVFAQEIDGKIYYAGGRDQFANTTVAYEYDAATDSWRVISPLLAGASGYGPARLGSKMYVFGGEDILSATVSTRTQVYDATRDSWEALEPMPVPLHGLAGASLGSSIYLFGGAEIASSGQGSNVVLRFDPPDVDASVAPPKKPKKLKAKALAAKKVRLKWKDKSRNEDGFQIEVSVEGGPFEFLVEVGANTKKRIVKGLTPDTTYTFRVRATNGAGPSAYSNERSVTTPAG